MNVLVGSLAKKFGKRLLCAREHSGLQVGELASAVGVSIQTITFWQSGKTFPKEANLERLGKALNVPVAWFFLDSEFGGAEVENLIARIDELELEAAQVRKQLKFLLDQRKLDF